MKKILPLLLSVLFLLTAILPGFAAEETENRYIFDEELDLLTDDEEAQLQTLFAQTGARLNGEIVVVLTDYCSRTVERDAKDFYNTGNYAENGIIFYCTLSDAYWNISSFGDFYMDTYAMDRLEETCLPPLRDGDYYGACTAFAETVEELVLSGTHSDGEEDAGEFPWLRYLIYALIAGLAVAGIAVLVMAGQLKSVHRQSAARNYLKQDSLNVTESRDLFLYRTVSRVARPKENSSSGRSSGGGGSRSGRI